MKNILEKRNNKVTETQVGLPEQRRLGFLSAALQKANTFLEKFSLSFGFLLALAFCGFLAASLVATGKGEHFGTKEFTDFVNIPLFCGIFGGVFVLLTVLSILLKTKCIGHWALLLFSVLLTGRFAAERANDLYFCLLLGCMLFIVIRYLTAQDRLQLQNIRFSWKTSTVLLTVAASVFTVIVGIACIARYRSFGGATFDIGIFTQMFEFMRTTGRPDTTVERYELTSHFAVHFSPFFYLLLPGYMLRPHPTTLLLFQAAAVALCVFPLRRICKTLGFSPLAATAASVLWLCFPSNAYGCFNDFHENKFLPLCLLWMLCMLTENRRFAFIPFAVLALSVKEDAAVYVACAGLFCLFARKEKQKGIILLILSVGWFVFATQMIRHLGGEAMMSRFADYQTDGGSSVFGVIKMCLLNFGYLLQNIATAERMEFLLWMLVPVLFAPFLNKSVQTLILLIPMLVINLMPSWAPQHDIFYQYTFGTAALIVFASILTFARMQPQTRRFCLTAAVTISFVFSLSNCVPKIHYYIERAYTDKENIALSEELLASVPEDASITARDFLVPHLYDRKDLYTVPSHYGPLTETDYYIADKRQDGTKYNDQMYSFVAENDYTLVREQGYLQLWKKNN